MVQRGQTFLWPSLGGNKEVEIVEADGDTVTLSDPIHGDSFGMRKDREYSVSEIRQDADPMEIHNNRPEAARQTDEAKDAPLTTDPLQWASDPSQHDFPGVDTGPTFRESEGDDFDTEGFVDFL